MLGYLMRRCVIAVGLIFVVATLIFAFLRVIPGDPVELILSGGESGVAPSAESVAALRSNLGLDKPFAAQYVDYLGSLAQGDLGTSFVHNTPVSADVATRLPRTLELILVATALASVSGIALGLLGALRRGTLLDTVVTVIVSVGLSVPVFVLGVVLVLIFAVNLGLLPAGGYVSFSEDPARHVRQLILPAISLAFLLTAAIARMTRSAVLEVLRQDWVRTARAKGLSRRTLLVKHVLRNALIPVITVIGLQTGHLLGGSLLVEYVFNWPGLSSYLFQSVSQRDYPTVQGIALVISALFIFLNLAVDLCYAILDPRVRHGT